MKLFDILVVVDTRPDTLLTLKPLRCNCTHILYDLGWNDLYAICVGENVVTGTTLAIPSIPGR